MPLHPAVALSFVATILALTLFFTPREQLQKLSPCTVSSAAPSTSDLSLRLARSETLWKESVRAREEFIRERGITNLALLGEGGGTYSVWDIYYASFNCPWTDERIGRVGDGGKWICGLETLQGRGKDGVIYSIGVERESSFEATVLDRYPHANIYGYDLSVDSWGPQILASEKYNSQAHFTKAGISAHDEPSKDPPNYSLKSMMKMNGHHWMDIFKIDVEGGEWDILKAIVDDFPEGLPFGQMQIEVHVNAEDMSVKKFDDWFKMLEAAGLRAFHFELNMPTTPGSGMYYAEYSFINTKSRKSALLGHSG